MSGIEVIDTVDTANDDAEAAVVPVMPLIPGMIELEAPAYFDRTISDSATNDKDDRVRRIIASTGARDRYGDEVLPSSWDLKWYKHNPVILWSHQYDTLPIGRAVRIERTEKALVVDVRFTSVEENPLGDQVLRLIDAGFLNGASVGFRSLASEWIDPQSEEEGKRLKKEPDTQPGKRFKKAELLEVSVVDIPANPEARVQAKQKGLVWPAAKQHSVSEQDRNVILEVVRQCLAEERIAATTRFVEEKKQTSVDGSGNDLDRVKDDLHIDVAIDKAEGHAETDKDALPVSAPSPDTGQPDAEALALIAAQVETLTQSIQKLRTQSDG